MKKTIIALVTLLVASLNIHAVAAPDAETKEQLELLVELLDAAASSDENNPLKSVFLSEEYNAVVFQMEMPDETIELAEEMPEVFKTAFLKEMTDTDEDMKEFFQFIGGAGYGLDFFLTSPTNEEVSTIISITADELVVIAV